MTSWRRQVRFGWRVAGVFLRRHRKTILVGIAGGAVLAVLARVILPQLRVPSGPVRIGLAGSYSPEDLPEWIQRQVAQGLTEVTETQGVKGALAGEWRAEEEGKVWVFKLKEGVKWQDGSPVVAEDINYGFSDLETTVISEKEVSMRLKDPFAPLPNVVAKPVFKRGLLGTGPYQVKQLVQAGGNTELLELVSDTEAPARLIYRFYATEAMAKTAFKLGQVDKLVEIADASEFEGWVGIRIEPQVHWDRYVAVFFNTEDETLANKSVRQALSYGLKKTVVGQTRAISPILPQSWAYNPQIKAYEYNKERAETLLKDNLPQNGVEINLTVLPSLLNEAERIKADWEELGGIKVQIQVANYPPEEYQALLVTQQIGADPDQYSLWHSTQRESNLAKYNNPRIDKLLEDGRKTLDKDERQKIYFDFQRFLAEDSPAIFLYHPVTYTVVRAG